MLRYTWFVYPEAGTRQYHGRIDIPNHTSATTSLTIPRDAAGAQIHVILQVWDECPIVTMVGYRRRPRERTPSAPW